MCTAISYNSVNSYFGRNLDYEYSFGEKVIIIPRNFIFDFKKEEMVNTHYGIIGIGIIKDNYPLMFDGMNEYGLSFAGLNFPGNAAYYDYKKGKINLAPYELPLWLLGNFKTVNQVKIVLEKINPLKLPFSDELTLTPLHFIFTDKKESIVYEFTSSDIKIYKNEIGVLSNNPVFPVISKELSKYVGLSVRNPECSFDDSLICESNGMGGIGLPGDLSSRSRFVRAAFNLKNIRKSMNEMENVTQFFHLLNSVYQQEGCVITENEGLEKTLYSSCMNLNTGNLYYTTYENSQITCISLEKEDLNGYNLISYPLIKTQNVLYGN